MASRPTGSVQQTLSASTSAGLATIPSTDGFWPGALCWLRGPLGVPAARRVIVMSVESATVLSLRFAPEGVADTGSHGDMARSDISTYGSGSIIAQEAQASPGARFDVDKASSA